MCTALHGQLCIDYFMSKIIDTMMGLALFVCNIVSENECGASRTALTVRKLPSIYVFSYFPFGL